MSNKKKDKKLNFPELILLNDFEGDFDSYLNEVYSVFHNDFIRSYPFFKGLKVSVRKYPEVDGMHRTFYHITHEGEDEADRRPDLRRMERIRFPRFVIDNNIHPEILIWKNRRGRDDRIILFNEDESYVVVLAERGRYYLFITAYHVEHKHRRDKLLKEYRTYINTKTA